MKEKVLWTMNIALVLVAVLLTLHLLDIGLPTLGKAAYLLDDSEPICIASFGEQNSLIEDMGSCCYGLQTQLFCENRAETITIGEKELIVDKKCYTGESAISYLVNMKAFNYCEFS